MEREVDRGTSEVREKAKGEGRKSERERVEEQQRVSGTGREEQTVEREGES